MEVVVWCPDPAVAAVLADLGVDAVVVDDVLVEAVDEAVDDAVGGQEGRGQLGA
jgi:hypothetical protein